MFLPTNKEIYYSAISKAKRLTLKAIDHFSDLVCLVLELGEYDYYSFHILISADHLFIFVTKIFRR